MTPYKTRADKLPGTSYKEVEKHAWRIWHNLERRNKEMGRIG